MKLLKRWRQVDCQFKVSLGNLVRLCQIIATKAGTVSVVEGLPSTYETLDSIFTIRKMCGLSYVAGRAGREPIQAEAQPRLPYACSYWGWKPWLPIQNLLKYLRVVFYQNEETAPV